MLPGDADSGSEDSEDPDKDAPGQQSGAEQLRLEGEDGMAFCLRASLHDALYVHQVCTITDAAGFLGFSLMLVLFNQPFGLVQVGFKKFAFPVCGTARLSEHNTPKTSESLQK